MGLRRRSEETRRSAVTLTSLAETQELLTTLPPHSPLLRLRLETADLLRGLTLADPEITVDRLEVRVLRWEKPQRRWVGRIGQVRFLSSYTTTYPRGTEGEAVVEISFVRPASLAAAARALHPLLSPARGHHGYAFPEIGTAALPAAALALLPEATAPGIPGIPSFHLNGVGLSRSDLALAGTPAELERLAAAAGDPAESPTRIPLLVDARGHLAVTERLHLPLVDLHLHNPIGRMQPWVLPPASLAATLAGDRLVLTATPTHHAEPDGEPVESWSAPVRDALRAVDVRRLRPVEAIDLSRLSATDPETEVALCHRLAELAATGTVLHSLPASLARADAQLGARLAGLLRAPYAAGSGLPRELRSVPQRREAMQRFGGFFELAGHAATLGHRLLPTVSVVLSSMRPGRLPAVLAALAAQDYPQLEVVVGLHGTPAPADPALRDALAAAAATLVEYDASVPFGSVLADLARRSTGDLVVKIDDDDVYGPHVIADLVLASLYSRADATGKTTEYLYFEDLGTTVHRRFLTEAYHYQMAGGAMMLSRAALTEIGGWRPTPNSTDRSVLIRLGNLGAIGYRTHGLGYVYVRHADGHTWKRDDSLLLANAYEQWPRFLDEIVNA